MVLFGSAKLSNLMKIRSKSIYCYYICTNAIFLITKMYRNSSKSMKMHIYVNEVHILVFDAKWDGIEGNEHRRCEYASVPPVADRVQSVENLILPNNLYGICGVRCRHHTPQVCNTCCIRITIKYKCFV